MYVAILAVSLNSIAFASHMDVPFIDTKDKLYVRLVYWPVIIMSKEQESPDLVGISMKNLIKKLI